MDAFQIIPNHTRIVDLVRILPDTLRYLKLPDYFNSEIRRYPRELDIIIYGTNYNSYIYTGWLPSELKILDLNRATLYQYPLNIAKLANLRVLKLSNINYNQPLIINDN